MFVDEGQRLFDDGFTASVTIILNGEPRPIEPGLTVAALLEALAIPASDTVAEINGHIVPRAHFPETALGDGDRVELIRFVGGG